MVTLQLRQLGVPPGHRVLFHDVTWQEFEAILEELGEKRSSRLAYINGTLEIRVPLPEHEKAKVIIGDLVKALLDECDRYWEPLGSTTSLQIPDFSKNSGISNMQAAVNLHHITNNPQTQNIIPIIYQITRTTSRSTIS